MMLVPMRADMRRREFISVLAGAVATPFVARAQQSGRTHRIGALMMYPENDPQGQLRAEVFGRELEKAGWTVGGNLQINYHWGTGDADWVRSAIAQVLRQTPDVMLANGDAAVKAAQQSTRTVPVILSLVAIRSETAWYRAWPIRWQLDRLRGYGAELGGEIARDAQAGRTARRPRRCLVNPDSVTHQRILALLVAAAPSLPSRSRRRRCASPSRSRQQ